MKVMKLPISLRKLACQKRRSLFPISLTKLLYQIYFFKDVGEVVRVQIVVDLQCHLKRCCFVEFASANQAKKALEKKNGEYLHNRKILLCVVDGGHKARTPKFCIDHKVWYADYHQEESLPIEEDETPPGFVEKVLFITNLSPQTTKIFPIIDFFKDVGRVVNVRLIVNHENKHVGYGFVEFASADGTKQALEKKNGDYLLDHKILLMRVLGETPNPVEAGDVRNKTLFVSDLSSKTKISHIINFFKDVGEVVHVRLIIDRIGKHVGCGFVEFASANQAKNALQKKNGEYLDDCEIFLDVYNTTQYCPGYRSHFIDHKVCNDESLMRKEEDEAVEGLDETPDFVEEIAVRNKTLFFASVNRFFIRIQEILRFFEDVGEVVRVRLIVDEWGEYLGCGYLEFASANEAKKAQEKDGSQVLLEMAEIASYPFRPKYNLADLAEILSYEDNLRQESLGLKKHKVKPIKPIKPIKPVQFCGKKTILSNDD